MSIAEVDRETFVYDQYERLWSGVYDKAQRILDSGETNLTRMCLAMRRDSSVDFSDPYLSEKYRVKEEQRRQAGFIFDRRKLHFLDVESKVSTRMVDALKMQEIVNACGDDIGRVIETGSGWGKTLFNVWLHGGPRDAEYRAMELTEAGRKTTQLVAQRAAHGMNIQAHAFDYYRPDFSPCAAEIPTLLYTHHSLEQMPEISEAFFLAMLDIPGFRRGVHLEPVGFQVPGQGWLVPPATKAEMDEIDRKNRKFAEKRNQNLNLWAILKKLEADGRIKITTVRKYLCSTILENATTLIVWEKIRPGVPAPQSTQRRDDLV